GLFAPLRQQPVDADGVDDGTGKNMRAHLAALFEDDDREVRIELLEPDRRGKAGRPGTDDHHVELHAFAFNVAHHVPPRAAKRRSGPGSGEAGFSQRIRKALSLFLATAPFLDRRRQQNRFSAPYRIFFPGETCRTGLSAAPETETKKAREALPKLFFVH